MYNCDTIYYNLSDMLYLISKTKITHWGIQSMALETLAFGSVKNGEKTVDLVVTNIKDALIRGDIKPGDTLPSISTMAAEMNVGVSSAREALKILEAMGVLEIKHGKGVSVCKNLSVNTMNPLTFQLMLIPRGGREFIEFRKLFETAASTVALKNATPEDIVNIGRIVDNYAEQVKTPSITIQHELDFHRAVLEATHNQYIIKIGETMLDLLVSSMQKKPAREADFEVKASHVGIYEAIRDKDEAKLLQVLEKSYDGWEVKYFPE